MTNNEQMTITFTKVKDAIQKLKNRKSPGLDHIYNEMLKNGGDILHEQMQKMSSKWKKSRYSTHT